MGRNPKKRPKWWNLRNWPSQGGSGYRPLRVGPPANLRYKIKRQKRSNPVEQIGIAGPTWLLKKNGKGWTRVHLFDTYDAALAALERVMELDSAAFLAREIQSIAQKCRRIQ